MKLNHVNLTVADAEKTAAFLSKHFDLPNRGGSKKMTFVSDDNGMVLTLYRGDGPAPIKYPESFHIGFILESNDRVNQIHAALLADGVDAPAPSKQHGAWTFYFQPPGETFTIEVMS